MPRAKKTAVSIVCPSCSDEFNTTDSRKLFCSRYCKDNPPKPEKHDLLTTPHSYADFNRLTQTSRDTRSVLRSDTQYRLYDMVFGTAPAFRADLIMAFLVFATTAREKRYIDLMQYPDALRSNRYSAAKRGTAGLHHKGNPSAYPVTLATMANTVCQHCLGITSRLFIDECKADGVAFADIQETYNLLLDTKKLEPLIIGCDVEASAMLDEKPSAEQIEAAEAVISDPMQAARDAVYSVPETSNPAQYTKTLEHHEEAVKAALNAAAAIKDVPAHDIYEEIEVSLSIADAMAVLKMVRDTNNRLAA
jgi:hypothetical protein